MKYWILLKNKYVLTTIIFLVWMLFLDVNNIFSQRKLRAILSEKIEEREWLIKEITKINRDMHDLTTNPKSLEKFAREKYLMKKDNEVIFVIMEAENDNNNSPNRAALSPL